MTRNVSRRELIGAGTATLALAFAGCKKSSESEGGEEDKVSPSEDLMREHGVLERLMVVYQAAARRIASGDLAVLDAVRPAARIAQEFVEEYHERIEEQYVFTRLEHANRLVEVVAVLRQQHDAGRALTAKIIALAQGSLSAEADRETLAAALRGYATMFAPHVGHEDTVVFPAFREVAGKDYEELGEKFEDEEHKRFGKDGFERFVAQLPAIESAAGVSDLALFTVKLEDLRASR